MKKPPASIIKEYLVMKGIRQQDLAVMCGVQPSTLSRVLTGEMLPGATTIARLHNGTKGKINRTKLLEARDLT